MATVGQQVLDQLRKFKTQMQLARTNSLLSSEGRIRLEDDIRRQLDAFRTVAAKQLSEEWTAIRKAFGRVELQLAQAEREAREAWDYQQLQDEIQLATLIVNQASTVVSIEAIYLSQVLPAGRTTRRAWQESAPSAILRRWPGDRTARRLAKRIASDLVDSLSTPALEAARRAQTTLIRRAVEAYVATEVARAEYYPGAAAGADEFSAMLSDIELARIGDIEMLGLGRSLTIAAVDPVRVSLN